MNLSQLKLSQLKPSRLSLRRPKLLAGGAAAALVVGLGFGWLARAPMDRAMAPTAAHPTQGVAPSLTIDRTAPPGAGRAPGPITAAVYPSADAFTTAPRPRAAGQDSIPASSDEQSAAYDETQAPRDGAEYRDQDSPPEYPPPPPDSPGGPS